VALESDVRVAMHAENLRRVLVRQRVDLVDPGREVVFVFYLWDLLQTTRRELEVLLLATLARHK